MKTKYVQLVLVFLSILSLSACIVVPSAHQPSPGEPEKRVIPTATLFVQPSPQPSPTPTDDPVWLTLPSGVSLGEIAYLSNRSGAAEIWLLDLVTSSERQLTETDCSDEPSGGYVPEWYVPGVQYFAWAPGGRRIAYLATCRPATSQAQLSIVDLEISGTIAITNQVNGYSYPSWDPSGDRFVFARDVVYGTGIDGKIYIANLGRSNFEFEPIAGAVGEECRHGCFETVWSPGGKYIAYQGPFVGVAWRTYVSIVDIEGNHVIYRPEPTYPSSRDASWIAEPSDNSLAWSNNGQYLAIATTKGYVPGSLRLAEIMGQEAVLHFFSPPDPAHPRPFGPGFYNPVFSPDDETLYFVSLWPDANGVVDIMSSFGIIYSVPVQNLLDNSSPDIQVVSPEDQLAGFPSLSPDGEWLVYAVKVEEAVEIWLQAIDGTYRQQLVGDGFVNTRPVWRPLEK